MATLRETRTHPAPNTVVRKERLESVDDIASWLGRPTSASKLRGLQGIGPKSVDYLACLVGQPLVPVDRHIRRFAADAGLPSLKYDELGRAMSKAASHLGYEPRDFDHTVWSMMSAGRPR